jgi:hypothetical protein
VNLDQRIDLFKAREQESHFNPSKRWHQAHLRRSICHHCVHYESLFDILTNMVVEFDQCPPSLTNLSMNQVADVDTIIECYLSSSKLLLARSPSITEHTLLPSNHEQQWRSDLQPSDRFTMSIDWLLLFRCASRVWAPIHANNGKSLYVHGALHEELSFD